MIIGNQQNVGRDRKNRTFDESDNKQRQPRIAMPGKVQCPVIKLRSTMRPLKMCSCEMDMAHWPKRGAIKAHFQGLGNVGVLLHRSNAFLHKVPLTRRNLRLLSRRRWPVHMAPKRPAPVAELVDAADSKSASLCEWEFESPRGHHRFFPEFHPFDGHADKSAGLALPVQMQFRAGGFAHSCPELPWRFA